MFVVAIGIETLEIWSNVLISVKTKGIILFLGSLLISAEVEVLLLLAEAGGARSCVLGVGDVVLWSSVFDVLEEIHDKGY